MFSSKYRSFSNEISIVLKLLQTNPQKADCEEYILKFK
ncbi:MAG: hypothetical protein CLLPBCKN_007791 [Chroococcidiopsis cubana SAG 39.79]|nr:hypothetical protein [Chroococcidiopsis cubana SAG 39.79]